MDELSQDFLAFNIWLLQMALLWPKRTKFSMSESAKSFALYFGAFYVGIMSTGGAVIRQLIQFDDYDAIIESAISLANVSGAWFVRYCFMKNVDKVKKIIHSIVEFKKYCPDILIEQTESHLRWMTKVMLVYLLLGSAANSSIPILDIENCRQKRPILLQLHDPCGGLSRTYYPINISGQTMITSIIILQIYSGLMISITILLVTMTLIGLIMHISAQLSHCRTLIRDLFRTSGNPDVVKMKLRNIIEYHQKIILFFEKTNNAFKIINLTYMFLTSLVISILGFKVLVVANVIDSIRYGMQLLGWMIILLFVCYYGQKLSDESLELSKDVYFISWYKAPVDIQKNLKMVIMRSQKPLQISAANLGFIAFPALLKVLKSAYSFFTLLLNTKTDTH